MMMIIQFVAILAVFSIVWWAISQMPLPPPLRIAAIVVMALIACMFILDVTGVTSWSGLRLHR